VMEIPPIQPVVTAYQWHQLVCPACGETTRAPWPAGVPSGTYGYAFTGGLPPFERLIFPLTLATDWPEYCV
jgi:hypothetical protein